MPLKRKDKRCYLQMCFLVKAAASIQVATCEFTCTFPATFRTTTNVLYMLTGCMLGEGRQVFYAFNLFFVAFICAYIFVYCLVCNFFQNQSFAFTQYPLGSSPWSIVFPNILCLLHCVPLYVCNFHNDSW